MRFFFGQTELFFAQGAALHQENHVAQAVVPFACEDPLRMSTFIDSSSVKQYTALQPHDPFKPSADSRLTRQIFFIDADVQRNIVAVQPELDHSFSGGDIPHRIDICDIAHDIVQITLQTIRDQIGIHDGIDIFMLDPA